MELLAKTASHDVAEFCGGAGGTGTLLVRRGCRAGRNSDIVCGVDLRKQHNKSRPIQSCYVHHTKRQAASYNSYTNTPDD